MKKSADQASMKCKNACLSWVVSACYLPSHLPLNISFTRLISNFPNLSQVIFVPEFTDPSCLSLPLERLWNI